jgi:tRNA A-37 threonylcarbamoyl transferase component Bud32
MHIRGVVHGDLYAHNILVSSTGSAMLGDFGAATCFADRESTLAEHAINVEQRALNILTQELIERVVS